MSAARGTHDQVWRLLPWYANETLDRAEREIVAGHLATCPVCREELERCRELAALVTAGPVRQWRPSTADARRILARIDSIEAEERQTGGRRARLGARFARLSEWLGDSPVGMRWALASQGALVLLLAGFLAWQLAAPAPPYRTLASVGEPAGKHRAQIRLVLSDEITEGEIRALLDKVGGQIVGGPSPVGAYTVQVPVPAREPERLAPILDALRASGKVRLAEPVGAR